MNFSVTEVRLGNVCYIKQGKYLGPNEMESNPSVGVAVPVIGGNGILGYTDKSTHTHPVPLVTCRGSKCGLMQWAEPPTWVSNNAMAVFFKHGIGDDYFLYNYFLGTNFDDVITGSAQPQITISNLSDKRIHLPDLATQRAISRFCRAVEKKIEVNNRLIEILRKIFESTFQSWFVDFDIVKLRSLGHRPQFIDEESFSMFPEGIEETDDGPIPRGWRFGSVKEIASISKISVNPQRNPDTRYLQYSIPAYDDGGTPFESLGKEILSGKYALSKSAVLLSKLNPSTRRIWTVIEPKLNSVCSTEFLVLEPNSEEQLPFLDALVRQRFFYDRFVTMATGSTGSRQRVRPDELFNIQFALPNNALIERFSALHLPMLRQVEVLGMQNQNLKELRESIFSRLVKGEISIPESWRELQDEL